MREGMNQVIVKIREGIAQPRFVRFLMIFGVMEGALLVISLWSGGAVFALKHVLVFSIAGVIPLSILCVYSVEKIGSGVGGMLSGWSTRPVNPHQTLAADLERRDTAKKKVDFKRPSE